MKDNLFEMLLNLFETSLTQLQESNKSADPETSEDIDEGEEGAVDEQFLHVQTQQEKSMRVFTYEEQMKLTKASYQFLMRMQLWGVITSESLEQVMNHLHFSDSRIVTLQETKWAIRNVLSSILDEEQLTFLDSVLYQTEDELTLH